MKKPLFNEPKRSSTVPSDSSNLSAQPIKKTKSATPVYLTGKQHTVLIRLTPAGSFFFGDESVNAEDGSMFYFQRSRQFPQQTALLGMLRYQLLLQHDQFDTDERLTNKENAKTLIGEASFNESAGQSFGAIHGIGPVFLMRGDQPLFPMSCVKREDESVIIAQLNKDTRGIQAFWGKGQQTKTLYELVDYSAKTGLETQFVGGTNMKVATDELFARLDGQVGIRKPQVYRDTAETEREGFFKMHYQQLKPGVDFAFYATLDKSIRLQATYVFMGKERSMFYMQVVDSSDADSMLPMLKAPKLGTDAIWLLSDACVEPDLYEYCQLTLTETVNFRNIRTTLNTTNHFAGPKSPDLHTTHYSPPSRRVYRRELLKRGSLLFPKKGQLPALEACLKNAEAFRKIGYNQYTVVH